MTNEPLDPRRRAEANLLRFFLILRITDLTLAVVATVVGWGSYRRPWLNVGMLLAALVEFALLVTHTRQRQAYDEPTVAAAEVLFGLLGLFCVGAALGTANRTTFLDWMVPYCSGVAACGAIAFRPRRDGIIATAVMAAAYALSVRTNLSLGGAQAATAAANILEFGAFYLISDWVARALRQSAQATVKAQQEALLSAQLKAATEATTRERDHWHRQLHNRALQTLESIAKDETAPDTVRNNARRDAVRLRSLLVQEIGGIGLELVDALGDVVEEFAGEGLNVELVVAEVRHSPAAGIVGAVQQAVHESLRNVAKHAQVNRVVVRAFAQEGDVEVTIRDHGVGFEPEQESAGFGIARSIRSPMLDIGGTADIWSSPGEGTLVTLRVRT